jgi:tetratricopeptide (TPR) repeat protein
MRCRSLSLFIKAIALSGLLIFSCKPGAKVAKSSGDASKTAANILTKTDLDLIFHFHNATREKILGNYDEAIRNYRKCLSIDPNHAASAYEMGIIAMNAGDPVAALAYSAIAYNKDPDNLWYGLLHAETLKANRKFSEVGKLYEKLIKNNPDRSELYLDYSNVLLTNKKTGDALDVLNRLEKVSGPQMELSVQKQRIYLKEGKLDMAVAEIQKLIDSNPDEPRYHLLMAEVYSANDMQDKALVCYQKALAIDPDDPYINLSVAESYRQKKDVDGAQPYLRKAFGSSELDIDSKVKILVGYYLMSENDESLKKNANELLDITMTTHPNDPKSWALGGDFSFRDKDYATAQQRFERAVELDKSKFAIWSQLLYVDSELSDYNKMLLHGKEAVELFPNEPSVYLLYGLALMQKKQNEEAKNILEQGVKLVVDNDPLTAQFYANLGDVYYRMKQMEQSDKAYEDALALTPNDTYVLNNYSYYLSLRKEKLDKAEVMSKKANELNPGSSSYEDTYGWILYVQGKYDDALIWLNKAYEHGGSKSAVILEHIGDVYFKLQQPEKALEYWIRAKDTGTGSDFLEQKVQQKILVE